jgi:hypothetical protein
MHPARQCYMLVREPAELLVGCPETVAPILIPLQAVATSLVSGSDIYGDYPRASQAA